MGSAQAQSYHSVIFGDKNSWDDWHLIPSSRPEFVAPKGKTKFITIPGREGNGLDITNALIAQPLFENRVGSLTFFVANGYGEWKDRYEAIRQHLHGKVLRAILEDDPNFYYEGRFILEPWNSAKDWSKVTIQYNVGPYKKDIWTSLDDWLWDPFDFETGIINNERNLVVSGNLTTYIYARQEQISPTITASSAMTVQMNGTIFQVPAGASRNPLMVLHPGLNTFIFTGNGTVSIEYRGGML